MGVFGFVAAGGGSIGVILGGVLTDVLYWHWIFLVNVPVGIARRRRPLAAAACGRVAGASQRLDVAGAVTITAALVLAVYAIVNGNEAGWTSTQTLGLLPRPQCCWRVFLVIESRVDSPLVPLRPLPAAQRRDRERGRRPLVGRDVRVVLPLGALPAARARLQPARGRAGLPAGER